MDFRALPYNSSAALHCASIRVPTSWSLRGNLSLLCFVILHSFTPPLLLYLGLEGTPKLTVKNDISL